MNIALVTVAYNGYGRFADQWLSYINKSTRKPSHVLIALGPDHGCTNHEELLEKYKELNLQFHFVDNTQPMMGPMRNAAVSETEAEWIMYLSIDDMLLPEGIEELEKHEADADYICISWESHATWKPYAPIVPHQGKTPMRLAQEFEGRGFIVNHSPYRRWLWEKEPYMNHDYPNAPFLAGCIKSGARFVHTDVPVTRYLQRLDSHAARLGRRGRKHAKEEERRKAIHWKQYCKSVILEYFG